MQDISNKELIKRALEVMNPVEANGHWRGDVAAALVTDKGTVYTGICVDAGSAIGFCAERAAIAQMFANKGTKVCKIVAVWDNNPDKDVYVLPPCGACQLFMLTVGLEDAEDIDVVMSGDKTVKLSELYPASNWPEHREDLFSAP